MSSAHAQTPAPPANPEAAEKAQRETDKVFKWILIQADKPKRPEAKPAVATAPPPAAAPSPKPVARAKGEGITEHVAPIALSGDAGRAVAAARPSASASAAAAKTETASAAPVPQPAESPVETPAASSPAALALAAPAAAPAPEPEPDEDLPLVLTKEVDPEFPVNVMQRLQKGMVRVRFEVQPDGTVRQTEVLKTSHARLNNAALEAVAQWHFQPLKHSQHGIVELAFDLAQ